MTTPRDSVETVVEEKIVVVMGPTGAGKTNFINLITERGNLGIGHGIQPGTTEIEWIKSPRLIDGHSVTFIDTPGLDDTEQQDIDIVTTILASLQKFCGTKSKLDAILYLHKISDNRMGASELKRLELFANLCGAEASSNVVFVTTMWDRVAKEVGDAREEELKSKFWVGLIAKGCDVKRFHATTESALEVLRGPLNKPGVPIPSGVNENHTRNEKNAPKMDIISRIKKLPHSMIRLGRKLSELSKWQNANPTSISQLGEILIPNQLSADDSLIIVMGLTGSGKSSFIARAQGKGHDPINNQLRDKTFFVQAVVATHPTSKRRFIFIDTPGFNTPTVSNKVIMVQVSDWLANARNVGIKLSAIICLHRITDNRVVRPAGDDFELLVELCGQKAVAKMMLVTTMWDEANEETGIRWRNTLQKEFWRDKINSGYGSRRFDNTQESAWRILAELEGTPSNLEETGPPR
ncbi:Translocase of chloroplast [Serendipita sp. 407]|nr:Translocase of chloroplast [Serendipita sp. 407]